MNRIRALVLGATGYIGRHIVSTLAASSWATPVAAARHGATVQLDATNAAQLLKAVDHIDAIVNALAGSPQTMIANATALHTALMQRPNLRLIHLSSMAAYGTAQGLVTEKWPLLGDLDPYSEAKAKAEQLLHPCQEQVTVLRPGCVYGNGSPQWTLRIEKLLRAHRLGDLGAIGDGSTNLVHVNDLAHAVLAALQTSNARGQAYNLAMPEAPTWNEYLIEYARALSATPVTRISGRRLKYETRLIAPALKIAEIICRKMGIDTRHLPASITPSLLRLWQQDIELSSEKATLDLKMPWTPWKKAIREEALSRP